MSKAFLFIALALIVALVSAKSYNVALVTGLDLEGACKDKLFQAAGKYWVIGAFASQEAFETANADCYSDLDGAVFTENTLAADAACFATGAKAGVATGCGIAMGSACAAADFCVSDNQCVAAKCAMDTRYVWKFDAVTAKADVAAAIQTVLATLEIEEPSDVMMKVQALYKPCVANAEREIIAPTITVVDQTPAGNGKWWLVGFGETLTAECRMAFTKITPATMMPMNVQQNTCSTCVAWANRFMDTNYFTCPCADAATIISQSRHKLNEGVKLGQVKDFFKTGDCLVSVNIVVAEMGEFVLQTETKTSADCTKPDPDAEKKAEELKKLVTGVTDAEVGKVTALAADCVVSGKWSCATVAKCATLRCGKNAACSTVKDAPIVCAGMCVAADETKPEAGKCNSASVVGYVVAVVAVIAAFVF